MTERPAVQARLRPARSSNDLDGTAQDNYSPVRTAVDADMALREAASAAAEAAARARSVAALLDEALAELHDGQTPLPGWRQLRGSVSRRSPTGSARGSGRCSRWWPKDSTNKAIAEALYVSPNTVKTHVASLLNKLHADTRAQLAAIATVHGLHHRAAVWAIDSASRSRPGIARYDANGARVRLTASRGGTP